MRPRRRARAALLAAVILLAPAIGLRAQPPPPFPAEERFALALVERGWFDWADQACDDYERTVGPAGRTEAILLRARVAWEESVRAPAAASVGDALHRAIAACAHALALPAEEEPASRLLFAYARLCRRAAEGLAWRRADPLRVANDVRAGDEILAQAEALLARRCPTRRSGRWPEPDYGAPLRLEFALLPYHRALLRAPDDPARGPLLAAGVARLFDLFPEQEGYALAARTMLYRARLLATRGDLRAALDDYQRVAELRERFWDAETRACTWDRPTAELVWEALLALARMNRHAGDGAAALEAAEKAFRAGPPELEESPLGLALRLEEAWAWMRQGNREQAHATAFAACRLAARRAPALQSIAEQVLLALGARKGFAAAAALDTVGRILGSSENQLGPPLARFDRDWEADREFLARPAAPPRAPAARGGGSRGSTDASENSVTAGLRWLARHQGQNGSWDAAEFSAACRKSPCIGRGSGSSRIGVTALALSALLGAGYDPWVCDRYVDPLTGRELSLAAAAREAAAALVREQAADGAIGDRRSGSFVLQHALAVAALARGYAVQGGSALREAAERATAFLQAARHPGGGWRYGSRDGEQDVPVTATCMLALVAAQRARFTVDPVALREGRALLESMLDPKTGACGYGPGTLTETSSRLGPAQHPARTAAVLRVLMALGDPADAVGRREGCRLVAGDPPAWQEGGGNDFWYWHHGTLALWLIDGPAAGGREERWGPWNQSMVNALARNQCTARDGCAAGSWAPNDRWGEVGGRVYATAINVLTLEVYYAHE
ncbi:MAG: hypothetical protein HZA54_06160 [Planctomycetes bacterium]|nr:hypothetical protein [Planctomycetota bacterium]